MDSRDTTGNYIHIATIDSGADDTWYTSYVTNIIIDNRLFNNSSINNVKSGGNLHSITKATDGELYID
jgi:hypothetical protein